MDSKQFKEAAHSAIDEIVEYYDTLSDRPVLPSVAPGYLQPLLPTSAPEEPESWSQIQADIDRVIMPGLTHWQSPNFMAFFPCNSSFPAMLGDMYSGAFNAAAFNWICSPAVTELETIVMDWVAKMLALPDGYLSHGEGGGIIQGTASEVIVTAVVAARERLIRRRLAHLPEGEAKLDAAAELRGKLVALGSEHAHSSTQKAAIIAGTRYRSIPAPKSANYAVTAAALRQTILECREKGLEPFYLTATLGSTATCAIDDLEGFAALTAEFPDLWIHVDAAFAGSALVCPEYQHLTPHLSTFSSFNVNLHKWLLVNFDCSAFFVTRRADLMDTYSITPSYLRNTFTDSGLVTDYRDWQIPLGRRFRALKVWFVLRSYGISGLQKFIRGHIDLGSYFAGLLRSRDDLFTVVSGPAFGLTTLSVKPAQVTSGLANGTAASAETEAANQITKKVFEKVDATREFFLTSTVLCGEYIIRVVSANPKAEEKYLKRVFEVLVAAAEEVRGEKGENGKVVNGEKA